MILERTLHYGRKSPTGINEEQRILGLAWTPRPHMDSLFLDMFPTCLIERSRVQIKKMLHNHRG